MRQARVRQNYKVNIDRILSFADYSRPDFGGVLVAEGMPYNIVYDISGHSLEYKDSRLNSDLAGYLMRFIFSFLLVIATTRSARREP